MGQTKILTNQQQETILHLYVDEKRGQRYCGDAVGIDSRTVKKFLQSKGIPIRNFSEAATESNKNRAKKVNHGYFKTESENMAWILGFIASDGCIHKDANRITINLSRTDREILERIKSELEIENEICDYQNKDGFLCSSLCWTSEQHKKDLEKYNIIPQKTFKLKPPTLLDSKYHIDYVRGYFDGDGSVSIIKSQNARGNGVLRWQVAGAVKEVIEFIRDVLTSYGIEPVEIRSEMHEKSTAPLYYMQYSSTATRKIYKILYTNSTMFLKRKKEHFEEILKVIKPLNEI